MDDAIFTFLNGFAHRSWFVDYLTVYVSNSSLFKGGIFAALLWWIWFVPGPDMDRNRKAVLTTLAACFLSLFLARLLALTLPFRHRPMHSPDLPFQLPYSMPPKALENWSSFPSDHGALFFTLATGLFLVSRRLGIFGVLYASIVICLPRVYLGLHFGSDLLAGALIGISMIWLLHNRKMMNAVSDLTFRWLHRHPASFYTAFFVLTWQITVLFDDVRGLGECAYKVLTTLLDRLS